MSRTCRASFSDWLSILAASRSVDESLSSLFALRVIRVISGFVTSIFSFLFASNCPSISSATLRIGCMGVRSSCAAMFMNSFCILSFAFSWSFASARCLLDSSSSLVRFFTSLLRFELSHTANTTNSPTAITRPSCWASSWLRWSARIWSICKYITEVGVTIKTT